MNVKEAVKTAKDYVQELFSSENLSDLGLEEIEGDGSVWRITVGFSRPWNRAGFGAVISAPARSYKVVTISDDDGKVISIKNRAPAN